MSATCEIPEPVYCDECRKTLSQTEVEHGEEGFGHQGRCCQCYESRMRGYLPKRKTT